MTDETLFAAALEKPDATARAAYLDSACSDPDTRKRIDALLAAHDRAGAFLARPAVAPVDPEAAPTRGFRPEAGADQTRTHGGTVDSDTDEALGFLAPPSRPDSLGRIGHYEVLEVLGRGGFGIVFRAFDEVLQRVVAVKVLAPSMAVTSPARKRFLREARSSASVRHENVVHVYAVEEQPLPYLVMEFIPGETLQQRLDRTGPLDVPEVLRIGRQIALGLAAAHENGLIHRDIKPSNILIDNGPQERVKITDFGLARAADDASISQSGVVAGTPMYMAPEQAKGDALDHRADLFSLGSVLYVMSTGRPPFRASGTLAVLKRVCEEDPRPIREVIPEVPEWLCRVIEKLLAKNPDERYQSAREAADVLADCEAQLKAHKELKDYSRIPGGAPKKRPSRNWTLHVTAARATLRGRRKWAVLAVFALSLLGGLAFAPAVLYVTNRGHLRFEAPDTLDQVTVLRNDPTLRRIDALERSWSRRHDLRTIGLPAGRYRLEAECAPGHEVEEWQLRSLGPFADWTDTQIGPVCEVEVPRGRRIAITILTRPIPPPAPKPSPVGPGQPDKGGWVQLFNGKDLTGWKPFPAEEAGAWTISNGSIQGKVPEGKESIHLIRDGETYGNFHLRAEARVGDGGLGGILFRWDYPKLNPSGAPEAFDAVINSNHPSKTRTGSLYHLGPEKAIRERLVMPDVWFTYEIIAQGDEIELLVNGKTTAKDTDRQRRPHAGRLALEVASPGSVVQFRKIEIMKLPPGSPPVEQDPRTVDLLALIDPVRDSLQGTWMRDSRGVFSPPPLAQLQVPYVPPDNYRLTMEVERTTGSGSLNFGLIVGGRTACITLDYKGGLRSGIGGLDGKLLRVNESVFDNPVLKPGRNTIVAEVRGHHIIIRSGSTTVIDWEGDPMRLTVVPIMDKTDGKRLYLGHMTAAYRFYRLELVPLPPSPAIAPKPVLLKSFDPAKDKAVPLRGDAKKIVSVEDGAWRIENASPESESGNFRIALGTITEGIPEDGILICRAKVKLQPKHKDAWGDLELGTTSPSTVGYDWPRHLFEYHGEITEWTEKEVRYPVAVFRKKNPPTITIHVGLHANGVLWVKDLEFLYLPPAANRLAEAESHLAQEKPPPPSAPAPRPKR